jgi:hypothetical protein
MSSFSTAPAALVAVSGPAIAVIIAGVAASLAVVIWFFVNRQNPEQAASHSDAPPSTTSEELYETADRPAGPDAEVMDPDMLGGDHRPPGRTNPATDER